MIIKLKNVRIAFCQHLFVAGSFQGADDISFSSTFLINNDDIQVTKVKDTIRNAATEKWAIKSGPILKTLNAQNKVCLHSGEEKAEYAGFEGTMFISSRSKTKPLVIGKDRVELSEASGTIYAGCYVNAILDLWAMDNKFGKRICATVKGVQFFQDGDAFSGSAPASTSDFDDISDLGEGLEEESIF